MLEYLCVITPHQYANTLAHQHTQKVPQRPDRHRIRREILSLLKSDSRQPLRPKEIARRLGYTDNRMYQAYRDVLAEMEEQQMISRVKGGRYAFKPRRTQLEGVLRMNRNGFGFVDVEGREEDIYIRQANTGTALDGDVVVVALAAPTPGENRREGEVIDVVKRARTQTVGTFRKHGRFAFVEPDDTRIVHDVYVDSDDYAGAEEGDKVVVSIDRFPDRRASPEGRVLQVLGPSSDPSVRVLSLALSMDVRAGFPEEAVLEANAVAETIPEEEIRRRLDLREKQVFTVDPVDANDFDDAIHIEELPNGNVELGVHIADVSYYVTPGTALDEEAYERGTSVYLVDRVIPMLPEKLSNRVCSLRPNEEKLTYSCIMEVTPRGKVERYEIRESVIRSVQRFAYEEVQELIDQRSRRHPLAEPVRWAARLARTLMKKRMREGSVDFDLPEVRVVLDDDGTVVEVKRRERKEANRLIEEFMLLANRTVAQEIQRRRTPPPFVYRVHDRPDAERIQQLAEYVRAFGYSLRLKGGNVESSDLNALLERVKGAPEAPVIEEAALRAMAKARYQVENIGHYGLAFTHYTHFTSPIRRYPDLMAHRLLKRYLSGGEPVDPTDLQDRCEHCSEREKAATEAERESIKLKQVEYMQQHVGAEFSGVVSGVTKFGVFVEMEDVLVEGLVHVRNLDDDYYEYDERSYRLVGKYSGKTYRLGDTVRVQVAAANVERREIDLIFVD